MITIHVKPEHITCGEQASCKFCPVALAIKQALEMTEHVIVSANMIIIGQLCINTPPTARRFINEFDSSFPKLAKPFSFELPIHKKPSGEYEFRAPPIRSYHANPDYTT